MKKVLTALITGLTLLVMTGLAQATLITIGSASYMGSDYKLIYDDDDTGYEGGGLVWLDYTHSADIWRHQDNWASGLGSFLTVTLDPGYTTDIDWTTGWRLPDTVNGSYVQGYEGDSDNDGFYSYTAGHNLANSEMGHLFYTELGNTGYQNTDGSYNIWPPLPDLFLQNTGDFDNLIAFTYFSGTKYVGYPIPNNNSAWNCAMYSGWQDYVDMSQHLYALAVHSGNVSVAPGPVPVPEPSTMLLVGSGLIGLVGFRKKFKK